MWLHKAFALYLPSTFWPSDWNSYPIFIKVCFIISVIAILGIGVAVTDIYVWRTARRRKEARNAVLASSISKLLMDAVVPAGKHGFLPEGTFDTKPFHALGITDKTVRRILVAEMINYRNYFSGDIATRIRSLYLALSLDKDAKEKLNARKWEDKVYALAELSKMDIKTDEVGLRKMVHDKNRYIRDHARLLLIKFTSGDPLDILREITEPLSQWEAFEIFLLFQQKIDYSISSLEGLIDLNKDPAVASLSLKLAVHFKDLSSVPLILNLLETDDLKLRAQAVAALGNMKSVYAENFLVSIYHQQPHEIQLEILTAIGKIQSGRQLPFLETEFERSEDYEVKKYASDAIIKLYPLSKKTIDKLLNNTGELNHAILSHSLNPLINAF